MNPINRNQGKKANLNGRQNENYIVSFMRLRDWECIRVPNGGRVVRTGMSKKLIHQKSPFDYVFVKAGRVIFTDVKHTEGNSFIFSKIKVHQLIELTKCEKAGFQSGYLVTFSKYKTTRFFSASLMAQLKSRGSFSPEDGVSIETLLGQ